MPHAGENLLIVIAISLIFEELLIDPGDNRDLLLCWSVGLWHNSLSHCPQESFFLLIKEANLRNCFQALAHNLARWSSQSGDDHRSSTL